MGIYTGGESTAIDSPRYLTLRQARENVKPLNAESQGNDPSSKAAEPPLPKLNPGEEQLHSYWAPQIQAGEHNIEVTQDVSAPDGQSLKIPAVQKFYVDAPRFALPDDAVHSTYPPPAHSDDHRILPHVVLTDPHIPWERRATKAGTKKGDRNRVPWLALITFTQEELTLSPEALSRSNGIFRKCEALFKDGDTAAKQTSTFALNLSVSDLLKVENITSPVHSLQAAALLRDQDYKLRGDFVFLDAKLFINLFSVFDSASNLVANSFPNILQYQYLSHVRNINTSGMAVAGVEQNGIFSIVIGARSGPLENTMPVSVAVHLVSVEGVEYMTQPSQDTKVAMCSLYSWNYTVLPPNQLNVHDAFESLGQTLERLRPPEIMYKELRDKGDAVQQRVSQRLADGYSLVRYRLQTGESTVAMYRGPFTPTWVPPPSEEPDKFNQCSNSGIDLQILDRETGILDISYSSAWQLGRVLALGDETFTAALGRFRSAIRRTALRNAKLEAIQSKSPTAIRTTSELIGDLRPMVSHLQTVHAMPGADPDSENPSFKAGGPALRWARPVLKTKQNPSLSADSKPVKQRYLKFALAAAEELSMSTTTNVIYDETNTAISTDWMIILAWVMDRMFLVGVPAHYLISDPSHLPKESLRFFHIDHYWIDALIDGALSLANHMGYDKDRVAIKHAINRYVKHIPAGLYHTPQIPEYGFYLRSELVTMFPDLRVITEPEPADRSAPLLRHEIVADGVMLCLLDRLPGAQDFNKLIFVQPPHQQRFAVANKLEKDDIGVLIRRQYTTMARPHDPPSEYLDVKGIPKARKDPDHVFIWGSGENLTDVRVVRVQRFAKLQQQALSDLMGTYEEVQNTGNETVKVTRKYFDDDTETSALFALQLNDPNFRLEIRLSSTTTGTESTLSALGPPQSNVAISSLEATFESVPAPSRRVLRRTTLVRVKNELIDTSDSDTETESGTDSDHETSSELDHDEIAANATWSRPETDVSGLSELEAQPPNISAIQFLPTTSGPSSPTKLVEATYTTLDSLASSSQTPQSFNTPQSTESIATASAFSLATETLTALAPTPKLLARIAPLSGAASSPDIVLEIISNLPEETPSQSIVTGVQRPPQDLIISISVSRTEYSTYRLREFAVRIPLGDPKLSPTTRRNYLMKDYTTGSTGPSMLSNVRFNALAAFDTDPDIPGVKFLVVRILPRAAQGWISARDITDDMSVLLSMALPNVYPERKIFVPIKTRTFWDNAPPGQYSEDNWTAMLINTDIPLGTKSR